MKRYILAAVLAMLAAGPTAHADEPDLGNVRLELTPVNDFAGGYDPGLHRYDPAFVRRAITAPTSRPVQASICATLPTERVPMTSIEDGGHCTPRTDRVLPGAASIVWTLRGPHPVSGKMGDLRTVRRTIAAQQPAVDRHGCRPLSAKPLRPIPDSACRVAFDAPLSAGAAAVQPGPTHAVRFEARAADGRTLLQLTRPFVVPRRVPLIVSVGESLAAGQGNPDVRGHARRATFDPTSQRDCRDDTSVMLALGKTPAMRQMPHWFEPRDYRSLRSAHAQAAVSLLADWPYMHFLSFAKSGARIRSGQQPHDILDQLAQVRQTVGDQRIDVLLLSAGGNDVRFGDVLRHMASDFADGAHDNLLATFERRLTTLGDEGYPAIARTLRSLGLNVGTVLINEYPTGLFNDADGHPAPGCGVFDTLGFWRVTKDDAQAIARMGGRLNETIVAAARNHGWQVVSGIAAAFDRHGYCAAGTSFFRSAEDSCDMQGDFEGTMHPAEHGTAAIAHLIAAELRRVLPAPTSPELKP